MLPVFLDHGKNTIFISYLDRQILFSAFIKPRTDKIPFFIKPKPNRVAQVQRQFEKAYSVFRDWVPDTHQVF